MLVDAFALTDLNRSRCLVALSLVDDAFGVRRDGVVDENVEVILRAEQCAYVAVQRKIWSICTLDGLGYVWGGGMHNISHLVANILLPSWKSMNVFVDAGVGLVCTHEIMIPHLFVKPQYTHQSCNS